ncbi:sce7726 family protein [Oceanobacter kriegii]|uniref:sce7726 family protein n=1 Tax=Oceanobacter kriegii TaxID=64972 RepID=UPI00146D96C9|nr:sce7726 family protein [Oceanobacter kriegii]
MERAPTHGAQINVKPEIRAKLRLIDHLIATQRLAEGDLLISEFRLPNKKRRVDLALFTTSRAIAFEIKTEGDNLSRLSEQVKDLSTHFDKVIVFCAHKHYNNAKKLVSKSIEIWSYNDKKTKLLQRGRSNIKNTKAIIELLPKYERHTIKNRNDALNKIRKKFRKNIELFWKIRSQKKNCDLKDLISISRTPPKDQTKKTSDDLWTSIIEDQSSQSSSESISDNSSS